MDGWGRLPLYAYTMMGTAAPCLIKMLMENTIRLGGGSGLFGGVYTRDGRSCSGGPVPPWSRPLPCHCAQMTKYRPTPYLFTIPHVFTHSRQKTQQFWRLNSAFDSCPHLGRPHVHHEIKRECRAPPTGSPTCA